MKSAPLTVVNKTGFHMRLASLFVSSMSKYQCKVSILFNGREIDGKNIMDVIAACLKQGSEITVRCDGPDEESALAEAVALVEMKE